MEPTFHPSIAGAYRGSPCDASGRPNSATGHNFGARRILSDRHCCVSIELQCSIIRGGASASFSDNLEVNGVNRKAVSRYDGSTGQGLNQESIKIPTHVAQTAIHATGSPGAGLLVRLRIIERGTCRFVGVIELAPANASSPDPARHLCARVLSQFARDETDMIKSCRESGRHALGNRTCGNTGLGSEPS